MNIESHVIVFFLIWIAAASPSRACMHGTHENNKRVLQAEEGMDGELLRVLSENEPEQFVEQGLIALKHAKSDHDTSAEASAYLQIAGGYENLGLYDTALEYYMEGLRIYESEYDIERVAFTLDNIGFIYWYLKSMDTAWQYYEKALAAARKNENSILHGRILNHMGLVLWQTKEYERSLELYHRSLKIFLNAGDTERAASVYNNMGLVYTGIHEHQKALDFYLKAMRVSDGSGRKRSLTENLNNIGECYTNLKQYDKAAECLGRAQVLAKEINSLHLLSDNYQRFSDLYAVQTKYANAYYYSGLHLDIRDSIAAETQLEAVSRIQTAYIMEKKQIEIDLLDAEAKFQKEKVKSQRNMIIFFIAVICILGVSVVIVFIQYSQKLHAFRSLVNREHQLAKSNSRLNVINASTQGSRKNMPKMGGKGKYVSSTLSDSQKTEIQDLILDALENDKAYRSGDLSLNKMSEMIGVNRTYVSQVINEKLRRTFSTLINEYRVRESKEMILLKHKHYTITAIAEEVGFNSTNAFNKAFKKFTGMTPTFYCKALQKQLDGEC